jgi:C-terminal processing protease CtpA/Prc
VCAVERLRALMARQAERLITNPPIELQFKLRSFSGGAADKTLVLRVGDEIMSVNNNDCTRMSRIEAWNFMKKLSDGTANLIVRQKLPEKSSNQNASSSSASATTTTGKSMGEDTATKVDRTIEETKHI